MCVRLCVCVVVVVDADGGGGAAAPAADREVLCCLWGWGGWGQVRGWGE